MGSIFKRQRHGNLPSMANPREESPRKEQPTTAPARNTFSKAP